MMHIISYAFRKRLHHVVWKGSPVKFVLLVHPLVGQHVGEGEESHVREAKNKRKDRFI